MTLWGLAMALVATVVLLAITPAVWPTQNARREKMRDSMTVLEHGGPLLLGRHGPRGPFYAVDFGDDEGSFVYIPLLSRAFGVADPARMLRYMYVALVVLTVAFYPLVFYRLTGSLPAGLAAPLVLLVCVLSMGFVDIYWIPGWGALALLPLIFLLARDWSRFGLFALAGISLVAGWLSSIRSFSGLGIVAAAMIVLLLRRWRWWRSLTALAILAVLYISINTFVLGAIRANRDHRLGSAAKTLDVTSKHTLWHNAYDGFGFLPNSFGIRTLDSVSLARVEREAPGTRFLSGRYEAVIRGAYLRLLLDHPGEAIRQYSAKLIVVIADTSPYLLIVLLTLPIVLSSSTERRTARRWMLLTIPSGILAFLPVMVARPNLPYEQSLYGVLGLVGIMGVCLLIALVEATIRERGGVAPTLAGMHFTLGSLLHSDAPGWRAIRLSIAGVVLLGALAFGGYYVRRDADRWLGGSRTSGVLMEHVGG